MRSTPICPAYPSDEDLISLLNANDGKGFELLYKKYWTLLLEFSSFYLPDKIEGEEVVQDFFLKLCTNGFRKAIHSTLPGYLRRGVRNHIFNYLRKKNIYKQKLSGAGNTIVTHSQSDGALNLELADLKNRIACLADRMPLKYKEVFVLHKQYDLPVVKTAAILSRPVDTVSKQVRWIADFFKENLVTKY